MATPATRRHSAAMVRVLPDDGNRYEVVHGELLVTPAPRVRHQYVCQRVHQPLLLYLMEEGLAEGLLLAPADISWDDDTLVQPDLFVADIAQVTTWQWSAIRTLHLVVEILSPATARADRTVKRRLYQEQGIPVYWIVDTEARQVEVWTPRATFPVIERERLTWRHPEGQGECVIDLGSVFRD